MKNRRAFTLIELLVTLAVSTVVIAAVGATLIFVVNTTEKTSQSNRTLRGVLSIKDYILENSSTLNENSGSMFSYNQETREFKINDYVFISDCNQYGVSFDNSKSDFLFCTIEYFDGEFNKQITFIVKEK